MRLLPLPLALAAFGLFLLGARKLPAAELPPPRINILLFFDEEDYLSPADDDATKRLCDMLTERGIRATFKIVGEKARTLERHHRQDVIAALRRHDIGYHSNLHSVHPTETEYLAECGWTDGIDEFVRREGQGASDVRRILGVPTLSCYGQPGNSWAPQGEAALGRIGVSVNGVVCYVDEGPQVGMDGVPFWYANALHIFRMAPNITRIQPIDPADLEPAKKRFAVIADRLRANGGGLISIHFHPCEWVQGMFWDIFNFNRGANPPRERWQTPPQQTAQETEGDFQRFGQYLDYLNSVPDVHWITASDLPGLYPDLVRMHGATQPDLDELAARITAANSGGLDYQRIGENVYSVADQFELFTRALNEAVVGPRIAFPLKATGLFGPDMAAPTPPVLGIIDGFAFRDTVRDVGDFIRVEHRVPARVFVGTEMLTPADFLVAMARAWTTYRRNGRPITQETVVITANARILSERNIGADTPALFAWPPHKVGFHAPKVMELARLQAWTIKPATPPPRS